LNGGYVRYEIKKGYTGGMMLREAQLDGTIYDKTEIAIGRIRMMAPIAERIYGGYAVNISGGKDSTVITDLAIRSGAKIKFETAWTGLEYPETVYFLRREKRRLEGLGYTVDFVIPRDKDGKQITMWKLIEQRGYPTFQYRFCCQELKEFIGGNSYVILGVRWAESIRRKNNRALHEQANRKYMTNSDNDAVRRWTENCMKKNKLILNPIIEWSDEEVWEYIRERGLPYNPLYDQGHKRVGCIGCPMRANKEELDALPRWKALYRRAGKKYLEKTKAKRGGNKYDIDAYYTWWVNFTGGVSGGSDESDMFLPASPFQRQPAEGNDEGT
jgi:phosphoadenosine phosphosulfate reductase